MKKHTNKDPHALMPDILSNAKSYMTPFGYSSLKSELNFLVNKERPKLVETVRWAASNGDRSENGDYIYGKKRLREIDKRVRYLLKRLENAEIVDPISQKEQGKIFFGATVSYLQDNDVIKTITIVGIDEADVGTNKISYISPVAKALLKHEVGDVIRLKIPKGISTLEVLSIKY